MFRDNTFAEYERAQAGRRAILDNPRLSDVGKREALARDVDPLLASAADSAASWLRDLTRNRDKAAQALAQAQQNASLAIDVDRVARWQSVIGPTIKSGSWATVQKQLDAAFASGDVHRMMAWQAELPSLAQRFDVSSGPSSDVHSGWTAYEQRVRDALPEPADVVEARDLVERADVALDVARAKLGDVDFVETARGGQPVFAQVLTPRGQLVTVGGDDGGPWIITHDGQGAFG